MYIVDIEEKLDDCYKCKSLANKVYWSSISKSFLKLYKEYTNKDYPVFALGCPSMGNETLEETYMEDFVTEVESFASGKKIGLFGSYGWGDGEWMRNWVARMEDAGAQVFGGEDAICMNEPDSEAEEKLEALGKELASL